LLSKIWVGDPGLRKSLSQVPDPGIKKELDPGSRSATLVPATLYNILQNKTQTSCKNMLEYGSFYLSVGIKLT
jgi:hypothetical protein